MIFLDYFNGNQKIHVKQTNFKFSIILNVDKIYFQYKKKSNFWKHPFDQCALPVMKWWS